jgi:hypothetical protein
MTARRYRAGSLIGLVALASASLLGQTGDEPPPVRASSLLAANVRKEPHYTIQEAVKTEGFFYQFTIESDYGELHAHGLSQVDTRLNEVRALAALEDVSKSEVFLESAGGSVLHVGERAAKIVTDPVDTAKGIGGGIKRLGLNIGRISKRAVDSAGNPSESAAPKENTGESTANAVLGVSGAMRRWARKVGADPYTTNQVLFDALKEIGRIDAAGSIATKVILPIPAVVTTSAHVGDLVWSKDPEELRKLNEGRLKALGVTPADAQRFFQNRGYTLTSETRLIAALDAVKPNGAAAYVNAAAGASGERAALFFVESAEMLQQAHGAAAVTAILDDTDALVARQGRRAVMFLPLDYVSVTTLTREVIAEVKDRVAKELGVGQVEVRLTGRASRRMRQEIAAAGWTLKEQQPRQSRQ